MNNTTVGVDLAKGVIQIRVLSQQKNHLKDKNERKRLCSVVS